MQPASRNVSQRFRTQGDAVYVLLWRTGAGKDHVLSKSFSLGVDEKELNNEVSWKDVNQEFVAVDKSFKSIVKECVDNGRLLHISFEEEVRGHEYREVEKSLAVRLLKCYLKPRKVDWHEFASFEGQMLLRAVIRRISGVGHKNAFVVIHIDDTDMVMQDACGVHDGSGGPRI